MRQDTKIFQITGDKSLENLLEFIVTKMEGNTLKPKSEVTNIHIAQYTKWQEDQTTK